MKKLTAIWILAIMLFNGMGYQLLTQYLQQRASEQAQAQIDSGAFESAALLELSVPLDLPYTTSWTGWEKFEGDIEIDGIHYRYVERKLDEGRMYVRCLPNTQKQDVLTARDEFFKLAYNINKESENKKTSSIFISNYIGDYDNALDQWSLQYPVVTILTAMEGPHQKNTSPLIEGPLNPPELAA